MSGLLQPRHWDPSLPHSSSMTSSTAASSSSFPFDATTDVTTIDQFNPASNRNSHSIEDRDMTPQQWHDLASSLGIPSPDATSSSPSQESEKFARKISKRRSVADKQLSEFLLPVLTSLSSAHPRLLMTLNAPFNRDAVPLDHPSMIFGKTRLPTPRPAMTIGYNPQIFHPHYRELMSGIICDTSGQPRNLDKISQACQGVYWPFFAVEISNDDRDSNYSTSFAQASAAAVTATCNSALLTVASTLNDISNPIEHDASFREMLTQSISSFSLAISSSNKTGILLAHTTSFDGPYSSVTDAIDAVATYNLTLTSDIVSLSNRLKSIFTWAETTRLLKIMDILDRFDSRVQFRATKLAQEAEQFGPMDIMQRGQTAPKLAPGQVQMSGGMGRGVSVPIPGAEMSVHDLLSSSTKTDVPRDRGRAAKRLSPTTNPITAKMAGHQPQPANPHVLAAQSHGARADNSGSRSTRGTGERYMPPTPNTPEGVTVNSNSSTKLSLNTAVAVNANANNTAPGQKTGKRSLFKTVLSDAMPAWTRVEI